jgi:predicted RecB family nuclease
MEDERLKEYRRRARLREQDEERRRRKADADLRLQQQEGQAQDEARLAEAPTAEEQHYAQLPRHSYTGIR